MSIFPFIDPQEVEVVDNILPMANEWAWDFEKLEFKFMDGKMYKVEGIEAIKIWVWKIFQTPRYRYLIYSWDYGHELEDLIGKNYTTQLAQSEIKRYVKEAILTTLEGYVVEVKNFNIEFTKDKLSVSFTIITPYGEVDMNV